MANSKYSFLKKLQQNEHKKDNSNTMKIAVVGGAPLSQRFGAVPNASFTGFGEDGVLQPDNPAKMVETENGTSMLHEGEIEIRLPDGRTTIIPANEIPQAMMQKLEKSQLKGYKCGGKFMRGYQQGGQFAQPEMANPATQTGQSPTRVVPTTPDSRPVNPFPQGNIMNPNVQGGNFVNPNFPDTQNIGFQTGKALPVAGQQTPSLIQGRPPVGGVQQNIVQDPINISPIGISGGPQGFTNIPQQDIVDPLKDTGIINIGPETITGPDFGTIPVTEQQQQGGQVDPFWQYFNQLAQISQGKGQFGEKLQQQTSEQFKAEEQAAKAAQAQELAQMGITGREALTEQAMLSREIGAQEAKVQAELFKQRGSQAFEAAKQLPGLALSKEQLDLAQKQFEQGVDEFDYKKQIDSLNSLALAGDYKGYAKLFGDVFGTGIDISHLQTEQDFNNWYDGIGIMTDLIASGVSWEDALGMLESSGALEKMGLTEGDAKAFYEKSQLMNDPLFSATQMVDGWVASGLITQEQADDYLAIITDSLVNPEAYKVEDGYVIKDANGNEVGFFLNKADADKFIADNPDKGYMSTFMDNHVTKTGTGGGTGTGTGSGADKTNYTTFIDDQVPDDIIDEGWFTQDVWIEAGKPATWDTYLESLGDLGKITTITDDNRQIVIDALIEGNAYAQSKFGIAEDDDVYKKMMHSITQDEIDPSIQIPAADITAYIGKIIVYKNPDTNEYESWEIVGSETFTETDPVTQVSVEYVNILMQNTKTGQQKYA